MINCKNKKRRVYAPDVTAVGIVDYARAVVVDILVVLACHTEGAGLGTGESAHANDCTRVKNTCHSFLASMALQTNIFMALQHLNIAKQQKQSNKDYKCI